MIKCTKIACYDDFEGSLAEFKVYSSGTTTKVFKTENYSPWELTDVETMQWYIKHASRVIINK